MANVSFTRDEVILALDVLYSSEKGKVSANSPEMEDLSALLNRLPIHPDEKKHKNFRTKAGITQQIYSFRKSYKDGKQDCNVGSTFFRVAFEFEDRLDELHEIADAIRRNEKNFSCCYGSPLEDEDFPEGILLGHLHRMIEIRDGAKVPYEECCEICKSRPTLYYRSCGPLLQHHLVIPPTQMDYRKKYGAAHFITVCPNCHAALHHFRPWLIKENCGELLR